MGYNIAMTQNTKNATEQATIKAGKGGVVPPKSKQFGQPGGNPRHNGSWKKEDTPRYKLEQMMKLTSDELGEVVSSKDTPLFEKKLAIAIKDGDWKVLESMTNQVYGTPKQTIEQTNLTPPEPLEDLRKGA